MASVPRGKDAVPPVRTSVAVPPDSVPVPTLTPLSLNVTVPVGVPAPLPEALTVAVKVTTSPKTDGLFGDELTAVLLLDTVTVWLKVLDVLVEKFVSPL